MVITIPFLDKTFFKNKENDESVIIYEKPIFVKIVYKINNKNFPWIGYFNCIKTNENRINIYFRTYTRFKKPQTNYHEELTSLIYSNDNNKFIDNNENVITSKNSISHNFYVNNLNGKYIGIGGVDNHLCKCCSDGIHLLKSKDGISWKDKGMILNRNKSLKQNYGTCFDSLNNILYNNYTQEYYIYARYNRGRNDRRLQISKNKNLDKNWPNFSKVNINLDARLEIYVPNIMCYNNSKYFIGFPVIERKGQKNTQKSIFIFSENGIDWNILHQNYFGINYIHRFVPNIIEIDDKYYMYIHNISKNHLEQWYVKKDRFGGIYCKNLDILTSKNINISERKLYINFNTYKRGYIKITIYDVKNNKLYETGKLSGDYLYYELNLDNTNQINEIYLKFEIQNSVIYSLSYS